MGTQTTVNKRVYKVLIIDNRERDVYSLKKKIMNDKVFHDCVHVKIFSEAKLLIEEHDFNIIICDYNMPQEDNINSGLEFLINLRRSNSDLILCLNSGFLNSAKNRQAFKKMEKSDILSNSKTQANPNEILLRKLKQKINEVEEFLEKKTIPLVKEGDYAKTENRLRKKAPPKDAKKMILRSTISHLNKESGFIELRIQNPENPEEFVYKSFPLSLLNINESLKLNQIVNIVKTVSEGGSIIIKFESSGEIEPPPKTVSKWDQEIRDSFNDIPPL